MSLPLGVPAIITLSDLAVRLGIHRGTLWVWVTSDPKWRGCIARASRRKIWLSVQRLIDNGLLPRPEVPRVEPVPGLSFTFETKSRAS